MINTGYQEPKLCVKKFTCPHCGVLAQQSWKNRIEVTNYFIDGLNNYVFFYRNKLEKWDEEVVRDFCKSFSSNFKKLEHEIFPLGLNLSTCRSCEQFTVWIEDKIIFPKQSLMPEPNEDLEEDIKLLYREASNIFHDSPRAAAALLRVCIEKLCQSLEPQKGSLHDCINKLSKKRGLNSHLVNTLHICRVIGNEAVHPGTIDFEEDSDKVKFLFFLVNDIADELVSKPKKIQESYGHILNQNATSK